MTRPRGNYAGLPSAPAQPREPVMATRTLIMPDGTPLICRKRGDEWTAEIPLELAKEIFTDE